MYIRFDSNTNGQISYDQEQVLNYSAIIEPETQNITISNFSVSIFTDQNVIFQEEILSANLELFIVEISADKNVEIIVNSSLPIYSSLLSRTVKGTASKNVAKFDLISNLNSEINLFNSYSANTLNTYLNLYSPNVITDIDFTISLDSLNLYLDQNSNEIIYDSTIFPTTRNITTTIKPSQVKVSSKFTATTFNLSSSLKASFVYGIICSDTLGLSTSFNNPTIEVEFDQFVDVSISIPSQTVTSEVKLFSKHAVISATTFYLVLNVKTSIVKIGKVVVLNSLNAYLNSKAVCLSNSFAANKLNAFINLFDNDLINKILVESIVSNESFGNAIINQNQKVLLSGIVSNESFGNVTINQKVLLSSIDSQEVFYQASCLLVKNVIFIAKRQNIKLKIFNAVVKAKKTKTKCVTNKDKNTDITWCLEDFKYEDQTWDLY